MTGLPPCLPAPVSASRQRGPFFRFFHFHPAFSSGLCLTALMLTAPATVLAETGRNPLLTHNSAPNAAVQPVLASGKAVAAQHSAAKAPPSPEAPIIDGDTTAVVLTAQRAQYDLALSESSGGNTLSASGSMTYTVHDACTAWSTQQHLDIQSATRSGGAVTMVSDYTTLESKDGRHLVFRTVQKSNNTVLQTISGEASLEPEQGGGVVHYEKPIRKTVKLPPGTMFPMAHTAAIIAAAKQKTGSISPLLFDGTGDDGAQYTYITAFKWGAPETAPPFPALKNMLAARVHVAFFGRAQETILPDYEIGMRYFANGVSDMLDMDFGDFRMAGTLRSLTIPSAPRQC